MFNIGKVIRHDRYILALNLRSNLIDNLTAVQLVDSITDNKTLLNLDIRDNLQVKHSVYRKLALKLLSAYT